MGSPGFLSTGDVTLCQDPVGWKAPIRNPSQPSTPQSTQHPKANQQQTAGHPIKQLEVSQEPVANGEVDSPTATSNGPAVQPVSAKKKGADKSKGKPQQATDDSAGGDAKHEDPEKKAKKVRLVMPGGCVHIACAHLFLQAIISSNGSLLLMLEQYSLLYKWSSTPLLCKVLQWFWPCINNLFDSQHALPAWMRLNLLLVQPCIDFCEPGPTRTSYSTPLYLFTFLLLHPVCLRAAQVFDNC